MSKKNLLIADDNISLCQILSNFFETNENINMCGICHNGEDTLTAIENLHPDVVLLDLIMPNLDGIGVLQALQSRSSSEQPKIIVMSAVGEERILKEAFSYGIQYYMIKPFSLNVLNERINLIFSDEPNNTASLNKPPTYEPIILKLVLEIGVPTNILGYRYILDALDFILATPSSWLVSSVYLAVAQKNFTSEQCVENAIRNAVGRAHKTNNELYQKLFPQNISVRRPSNSLFLTVLAERIKINSGLKSSVAARPLNPQ